MSQPLQCRGRPEGGRGASAGGPNALSGFFITVRSPDSSALQLEERVLRVVPVAKGPDLLGFRSVPKLRIRSVTPVVEDDGTVRMNVEVENYGDVEVAPQGYPDFLLPDGRRVFATNLGGASNSVEPHSTTVASVKCGGVTPKGDYTVRSVLSYHGESEARYDVPITISEDIIPAAAPNLPDERKAQLSVVRGIPTWVTAVAVASGVVVAVVATLLVQKYHLLSRLFARDREINPHRPVHAGMMGRVI